MRLVSRVADRVDALVRRIRTFFDRWSGFTESDGWIRTRFRARRRGWAQRWQVWGPRLKWLRVAAVVLVVVGGHRVLGAAPSDPLVPVTGPTILTDLSIYLPAELGVGEPVTADVVGAVPGAEVSLLVAGTLTALTLTADASAAGVARFIVPAEAAEWSGKVSVVARSGRAAGRGSFELLPGRIIDPLTTVVGPSSIVADGTARTGGVVIPMDKYGNAAVESTPVRFRRVLPGGQVRTTTVETRNLIAHEQFNSEKTVGINQIHAELGDATGPTTRMDEVAGPPTQFRVLSRGLRPAADGRSLLQLQTTVLRDQYGNVQSDGTLVTLFGNGPAGSWRMPASTVAGRARFTLKAPVSPGVVELVAHCRGAVSEFPLTIAFARNGSTMPVAAERKGDDVIVRVGPVADVYGALVDDGALVTAVLRDRSGRSSSGSIAVVDGTATVRVSSAALQGKLTLSTSLLGIQSTTSLP